MINWHKHHFDLFYFHVQNGTKGKLQTTASSTHQSLYLITYTSTTKSFKKVDDFVMIKRGEPCNKEDTTKKKDSFSRICSLFQFKAY